VDNFTLAISGVLIVGLVTVIGVFKNMKEGFGPFNLKVLGIVLIATFTTVLGLADISKMTAATGILGAIAGYLFGLSRPSGTSEKP